MGVSIARAGKYAAGAGCGLALRAALGLAAWPHAGARADEPGTGSEPTAVVIPSSLESWTGADATRSYTSIWTGLTWSPFGNLQEQGIRLRLVTGGGRYAYDGWTLFDGMPTRARFHGITGWGDALAGYHLQLGTLTLKPFAGISMVQHVVAPIDPVSQTVGRTVGIKLALDSWLRLGPAAWLNVDGGWTAVHATAQVKGRLGYRVWRDLSVGVEASALSDVNQEMRRAGLFVRYAWERGEVSIGGGVLGRDWQATARSVQPYAGATYLSRF